MANYVLVAVQEKYTEPRLLLVLIFPLKFSAASPKARLDLQKVKGSW